MTAGVGRRTMTGTRWLAGDGWRTAVMADDGGGRAVAGWRWRAINKVLLLFSADAAEVGLVHTQPGGEWAERDASDQFRHPR